MDHFSFNRSTLNTRRIRRVDDKVMVFVFPTKAKTGEISAEYRFPFKGEIKEVYASCASTGGDETRIMIEKSTQEDYDVVPVWSNVLANPLVIKQNRRSITSSDTPYTFVTDGEKVNKGDHFRASVLHDGGVGKIVVEIVIELDIEEE